MNVYTETTLPKLKKPQCFVTYCDFFTGIVLDLDGEYNLEPNEFPILLFKSYEEAKDFSENKVLEKSYIECDIFDHNKKHLEKIVSQNPEKQPVAETQPPRKWWQFW